MPVYAGMSNGHRFAAGFAGAAGVYDRGRAPFGPETVAALRLVAGTRVLDLAAGTGLASVALVTAGFDVVAVESLAEMRRGWRCRRRALMSGTAAPRRSRSRTARSTVSWSPTPSTGSTHRARPPRSRGSPARGPGWRWSGAGPTGRGRPTEARPGQRGSPSVEHDLIEEGVDQVVQPYRADVWRTLRT